MNFFFFKLCLLLLIPHLCLVPLLELSQVIDVLYVSFMSLTFSFMIFMYLLLFIVGCFPYLISLNPVIILGEINA